jgi:large subunit ribosomal protein L4
MPVVDVVNLEGRPVGQVELADAVFAAKVNAHLLHEAVRWHRAVLRSGTHKTKTRGEVRGSGRKLWRQKGTGRARVGSIRSPLWRKGGTVHGPVPRDYSYRLPRKVLLGALRSALSAKLADGRLTVVEAWALETPKTKALRQALDRLDGTSTILLVESGANRNLELASRNLEGVNLAETRTLGPYDVLRHDRLMLSKPAAVKLSSALGGEAAAEAPAGAPEKAAPPVAEAKQRSSAKPRAKAKAGAKAKARGKAKVLKAKPEAEGAGNGN